MHARRKSLRHNAPMTPSSPESATGSQRPVRAFVLALALALIGCAASTEAGDAASTAPRLIVLGIAQDGGVPQAGAFQEPGWDDPAAAHAVVSLGLIDPASGGRWMFEATPDFRNQLTRLDRAAGHRATGPALDGVFLTHAHIGHYLGLAFLGHEAMGARETPVWAMPRFRAFLESNGPWDQLIRKKNIVLKDLEAGHATVLASALSVTPILVPHRDEYSETVGFIIAGPARRVLFIPDIDAWTAADAAGLVIEDLIRSVDRAYLDGTFFANGEIPGRDMTGFPHPFITRTLERFRDQPIEFRKKIRFIHLNHTNPALDPASEARRIIEAAGAAVAEEGETFEL